MNLRRPAITAALVVLAAVSAGCASGGDEKPARLEAGGVATSTSEPPTTTAPPTTTTTTAPKGFVRELVSDEGWRYRIHITPSGTDPDASADGCIHLASPGRTNLTYTMAVENILSDRPAPWPRVSLGLNLNEAGTAVDPAAAKELVPFFRGVNIDPNNSTMCFLRFVLGPSTANLQTVPAGSSSQFAVTVGPIADPIPSGTALLVRLGDDKVPTSLPVS